MVQIASDHSHPLCSGFHNHRHDLRAEILITESVLHSSTFSVLRDIILVLQRQCFHKSTSISAIDLPGPLNNITFVILCNHSVFAADPSSLRQTALLSQLSLGYPCMSCPLSSPKRTFLSVAKILRFRHLGATN